jgi:hypothetical protein
MSGKLPIGLTIVSMEQQTVQVNMRAAFAPGEISASEKLTEFLRTANLWRQKTNVNKNDNFNFENVADILPKDDEYILVPFRALSKTIVPGHWIDWSKDNVLKDATAKLLGTTVYPNHEFTDINNWLGSVSNVVWDEEGKNANGVPGINATYKIDALMNPRIARGLLMSPPAIHSTSMTVLFKFEPSHPEIFNENRWRFFDLLGEEVEGSIVRLVVTEIIEFWDASLVYQGADRLAKKYDEDDESEIESLSAAKLSAKPTNSNEVKTMKLTKEKKAELGIEFDGEEVPETELLKAAESLAAKVKPFQSVNITELQEKAAVADGYVTEKRSEVTRLARIAELGADEGELDEVVKEQINGANFETLQKLGKYFEKKAADKLPNGQVSQTGKQEIETAGGVEKTPKATVPVGGMF